MSHDTSWYGLYPQDLLLEGMSTQLLLTHLIYSRYISLIFNVILL